MALKPGNGGTGGSERDPRLDLLYRGTAGETPPAHLDAAILAAARREVGARPRALSALRRWRVPVSIAAVVVLSVSLVTLVREEGGETLLRDERLPAAPPAAPMAALPEQPAGLASAPEAGERRTAAPDARKRAAPAAEELTLRTDEIAALAAADARSARERDLARSSARPAPRADAPAGPAPASAPPAAAVGGYLSSQSVESAPRPAAEAPQRQEPTIGIRGSTADVAPWVEAPKPAPKPMEKRMQVEQKRMQVERKPLADKRPPVWRGLEQEPPQKWLERLAELRKQERTGEAEELLAEFKRRFPDYPLPGGTE